MNEEAPRRIEARRGCSLSYRGKTLLSLIDPIAQAERIVQALPVRDRTLYFCPSPLYGYGLSALLERLGPGSAVLCVETDERLMALSAEFLGAGNPRLSLARTTSPGALCAHVRKTWGSRAFRRVETLRLTGGWRLDQGTYEGLEAALIRDIVLTWGNAMTLVKLGRRYARNALRNLSLIPRSAPFSRLRFGSRPLLVLGAGPSLDGVLPALLRVFGPGAAAPETRPFGIVCVDTALPVLRDWGIRPDLAVALECQVWNLRDFIGLGDWRVPLAMDLSAHPATGRVLGGELFLFSVPWTNLAFLDRLEAAGLLPESLPPLGSVGLTATALALRLSTGPVIVSGLDFSFTLDRYHARSSPGHRDRLALQSRFSGLINAGAAFRPGAVPALSKAGLPARTDPALKSYRDLFEREFSGEARLHDIAGPGLPLGLATLSPEGALAILGRRGDAEGAGAAAGSRGVGDSSAVKAFIREERESLVRLRDILAGLLTVPVEELEALLDRNDYLWAHFPECAAREGRRPPATDLAFLKRARVEIEPALKLFDLGLGG